MVGGDLEREIIGIRSYEGVNEENRKNSPGEEGEKQIVMDEDRMNNTTNI